MPFGLNKFKSSSSGPFDRNQDKNFTKLTSFQGPNRRAAAPNPFDITRNPEESSEVRFYNQDSLWSRWRRGYELYSITQSTLGSSFRERKARGDYRLYFSFQQFPGIFVPARLFTYPSANNELLRLESQYRKKKTHLCRAFPLIVRLSRYLLMDT